MYAAALLVGCQNSPEDRLWVDSSINNQPVHLFADTGSTISMLRSSAVEKLGLKTTAPPSRPNLPPGTLSFPVTELGNLSFFNSTDRIHFGEQDMPEYIRFDADGVVGWSELRRKILLFDAIARQIQPLDKLPDDIAGWTRLRVFPSREMLIMEMPMPGGSLGLIYVDTGNPSGVGLSPEHWQAWSAAHPGVQKTMRIYYTPGAGVVTCEQSWAREISLGSLTLTDTPVEEGDPVTTRAGGPRHVATLGLAALRRLDFILDGPQNVVYLRPKNTPPMPFEHNRLGAVFTLLGPDGESLVAHVADGTPAYQAGLRNGDIITKINNVYRLNWEKHPSLGLPDFVWPSGTKITFQILREGGHYLLFARLRDLIGPDSSGFQPAAGEH